MANSYRHSPFMGICSHSDKPGKVLANRRLRRHVNQSLATCLDYDGYVAPALREVSNVWDFPKDGKMRIKSTWSDYRKYLRK